MSDRKAQIVADHGSVIDYAKAQGKPVLTPVRETENGVLFVHLFTPGKKDAEMLCFSQNASEGFEVGDAITAEQAAELKIIDLEYEDGEKRTKISLQGEDNGYTSLF